MVQSKEWISLIAAAQRIGCTVEEVEQLIKDKKLESKTEYGRTTVTRQSVYDYTGLKKDGKQTGTKPGRKPVVASYEEVKYELHIDDEQLHELIKNGDLERAEMDGGKYGVTKRSLGAYRKDLLENDRIVAQEAINQVIEDNQNKNKREKEAKHAAEKAEKADAKKEEFSGPKDAIPGGADTGSTSEEEAVSSSTHLHEASCADDCKAGEAAGASEELSEMLSMILFEADPLKSLKQLAREPAGACVHDVPEYTKKEAREAADIAYKMGKLAVYESMESFERR